MQFQRDHEAPPQLLTVKEAADMLRCSESTIYRLLERGKMPAFRVGADWRLDRGALLSWAEKGGCA